jgi:dTDP-4-amino-4,6-dideoxygalactose transaminase
MERINVTKASLPPLDDYVSYLKQIWNSAWLTNHGPLLQQFEKEIQRYLGVTNFQLVANGTLGLQVALNALNITEGEVITTPFTYVATTSAILWERCTPVFVDIEPNTFCIDVDKIEAAITKNTRAIMAVHVFGYPCDVEKIDAIAKKHKLKVIYDGAHAFGVDYKGKSLLDHGDISICSFHATKLFQTIEGGGLIARNKGVSKRIELIQNFGHIGDEHFIPGINAKASEFQAAMGLANMKYIDSYIAQRKEANDLYDSLLGDIVIRPQVSKDVKRNYAYYPVLFKSTAQLLVAISRLNAQNIYPRRYFYPSLNTLPYIAPNQACPISEDIASRIVCLPLYAGLRGETIKKIVEILQEV